MAKCFALLMISLIFLVSCAQQDRPTENAIQPPARQQIEQQPETEENIQVPPEQTLPPPQPVRQQQQSWQPGGIAIQGTYADAEIAELGDGNYRMYYSIEPEVPGNKLEVFSATSTDGTNWVKEDGIRKEFATFPDVVKLPDGRFRMYFQNAGVIKSATSHDGLTWVDDPGVRIDKDEPGFILENVGAQGTIRLEDGTYIMLYRGTIDEPYRTAEKIPNKDTHIYFRATSKDGLDFEKKGLAIDSRNEVLLGAADGAEWVKWDQTSEKVELRIYFWSYAGVYHAIYQEGLFSEPVFDFTNKEDNMAKFPPNPPSDPTFAKIKGKWLMYYGQHTKGIYYATFETQETQMADKAAPAAQGASTGIPESIESNCIGFLVGIPSEVRTILLTGAGWARPHPGPFVWDHVEPQQGNFNFEATDDYVKNAQDNNIAMLATVWPYSVWDQSACHGSECQVSSDDQFLKPLEQLPKSRCAPCSLDSYDRFLTKIVERYDGDGIDDMPGLRIPVKYWEILNEPEMNEPDLTFYKGTQEEYVGILKNSNKAVKTACADCKIVQGGAAGIRSGMLSYWGKIFDLGGAAYFDIANIHYINSGDLNSLNVKDFKNLMQEKNVVKPIWVTEAEYSSESQIETSVNGALNAGASKIFFTRFIVGQRSPPPPGQYSAIYEKITELCPKIS
ncbi:hypothetical protein HYV81_04375 [Candidatus Woesearchaeota archaeon]|nr:hypothetical protein [Candidatus Woesearchaeota archaeon]